jgi:ADP-dependent NAD(P)H-hydrate dehydratase
MPLTDVTDSPLPQLPPRPADSHKGDYGRALLIGGSRGMSGAIALAGRATLRSGAGLVTLAVPQVVQDIVAGFEPSYMTHGLADNGTHIDRSAADEIVALSKTATTLALGPGIGRSSALTDLVRHLFHRIDRPMVVDADALFALAARPEAITLPGGPRILTPHPGEFARLVGQPIDSAHRSEAAADFAKRDATHQTIVVLKGHQTIVTDGTRVSINHTGNPGMATGGSGDVLTGIITALVCQGLEPFDAARLGVYVHGLAGDLAAAELAQVSLIASDLIDYLPYAFQSLPS